MAGPHSVYPLAPYNGSSRKPRSGYPGPTAPADGTVGPGSPLRFGRDDLE